MASLKVRARAGRFISDRTAAAAGVRRFVGRVYNPDANPSRDKGALTKPLQVNVKAPFDHRAHFPRHPAASVEVPNIADYRKAVRKGDLIAVDAATAKACRADFTKHTAWNAEEKEPWDASAPTPPAPSPTPLSPPPVPPAPSPVPPVPAQKSESGK